MNRFSDDEARGWEARYRELKASVEHACAEADKRVDAARAERDALRETARILQESANTYAGIARELREAALDLAREHMGMDSVEELLLWLETLPATDPGHDTPWGRFFALLAKAGA